MITHLEFNQLHTQGFNRIPLILELFADLDTPLSIYLKLANKPYTYLLESVVGGERFGRYSFIGLTCKQYIRTYGEKIQVFDGQNTTETLSENPLEFIHQFLAAIKTPDIEKLPRFTGGLVGYFGSETIHYVAPELGQIPKGDELETPDVYLMLSEELAVIDNLTGKLYLIVYANPEEAGAYEKAKIRLEELRSELRTSQPIPLSLPVQHTEAVSQYGQEHFERDVDMIKSRIQNGEFKQVVLSQRMSMPFKENPLNLYRALRALNPSPYLFFYHFEDFHIVGSSPEILVRQEKNTMTIRPIAGTRKRGKTPAEDLALEEELLNDPKEIVEHVMLIDVGCKDIGQVCPREQVKVTERMTVERYSHVMHLVSNVEGRLTENTRNIDVLMAAFPAGTLSGAPKIASMKLLEETEPCKRGIYGGAVGYMSFNGDMDMAIAIRTAIIKNQTLYVQSGAGIVADSNAHSEWLETQNKAQAIIRAAQMVQDGLDA